MCDLNVAQTVVSSERSKVNKPIRMRINRIWFFFLSERFNPQHCQQYLFFICQHSSVLGHWSYTLVPQSKTWTEARNYCKENFDSLATLKDDTRLTAAVVQKDFPVWIGLYREGEAQLQPSTPQQVVTS